jgi:ferredoxin-NADP reductase
MANPAKIQAIVREVVRHTDSVVSYRFAPQGRVPKFRSGQFLHIALDDYHPDMQWPESRVFSIASSPSQRHVELAVTISVKGRFTERIYQSLETGSECWLKLPYGEFCFPKDKHATLIAGGVGITPYLSLLKQMLEEKSEQAVSLYYGIRSAEYYLFSDLLDRCEAELPNFSKTVYCEDGSFFGEKGILNIQTINEVAPEGSLFYLSGPPEMIQSFREYLITQGVSEKQVITDDWE